jgi:hypothetical protein
MLRISTINKKSVVELVTYKKGKAVIIISRTYRFGQFDTEDAIDFPNDYNIKNGIDVLAHFSLSNHALLDCSTEDIEYRNVTKKDQNRIEKSEGSPSSAFEEQGFQEFESEWWFCGPLRVEQVNS